MLKKEKKSRYYFTKKKTINSRIKKKKDTAKKSKYYSKKDFALAKKAILEMKQAKWPNALKQQKKPEINQFIILYNGDILLTKGNKASYYEYKTFIDANENYPRIGRVKYLAEHKLSTDRFLQKNY